MVFCQGFVTRVNIDRIKMHLFIPLEIHSDKAALGESA